MTATTVQQLAEQARAAFELRTRDDGSRYWARKDGSPEWIQDMAREAHGDMMPDDWRYVFIVDALDALAENEDEDEARDSIEADVYTHDLTAWLHSSVGRVEYITEALDEYGIQDGFRVLALAQHKERLEVFESVLAFLSERAEQDDSEQA